MDRRELQHRLDTFLAASGCPGASLAVLKGGEITAVAGGVLNLRTGVEATTDSVFQIGSITKTWTATQIMQLVDQGKVELDAPVTRYLPGFSLAIDGAAEMVTIRHLLTHTSGIEGDVFDDAGVGDDCVGRYVDAMSQIGSVHDLDETWSYCNSGWVLLGHVIESITGKHWDAALKEMLGAPLGLTHLFTTANEAILHRAAVGHLKLPGETDQVVTPEWLLPRGVGPAGLITTTTTDLLTYGRMHLSDGRAANGEQVLSPGSVKLMQEVHAELPDPSTLAGAWGLGWMLNFWEGGAVIGHNGGTLGQTAFFKLVPEKNWGFALLTNFGGGADHVHRFEEALLRDAVGIQMPARPQPTKTTIEDLGVTSDELVGTYRRYGTSLVVSTEDGELTATMKGEGAIAEKLGMKDPIALPFHPHDVLENGVVRFLTQLPQLGEGWLPVAFYGNASGKKKFLHVGGRVARRAD